MLRNLHITNAAVARDVDVDFEDGFTVITGETGSGKSVMIDCLEMITGGKGNRDIVRSGENKTVVTALFDMDDCSDELLKSGICTDENGELLVMRSITTDGKSSVKINGRSATLASLKNIGIGLIGINTQDEKTFLSDKSEYVGVLDNYIDNGVLLAEYRESYRKLSAAQNELDTLNEELREKNMMVEILTYQIKEIDSARLNSEDEEEKLIRLKTRLKSSHNTVKNAKIVYRALSQNDKGYSAAYLLERASAALGQIADGVDGADEMIRKLDEYRYELIDIAETVYSLIDEDGEGDPAEKLNQIESRLNTIEKLKRKYGATIAEIKEFRKNAAEKLKMFTDSEETVASLKKRILNLKRDAAASAEKLRESRKIGAKQLSDEIVSTLRYLDMPKVKFYIEVLPEYNGGEYKFSNTGADEVDFKISINPGEAPMSIAKVASGGEMSRVMLALRSSINKKTGADTVVFDEIDAGVSGSTSERIGLLLKKLSENVQVICITHSPQIAAVADNHYLIRKSEVDGRAESSVTLLDEEQRVDEIARIIGGIDVTDKQKAAAREMILQNKK